MQSLQVKEQKKQRQLRKLTQGHYFLIDETLKKSALEEVSSGNNHYVAVMGAQEFAGNCDKLGFGIDIDTAALKADAQIFLTKAEVNYDSLTGSFSIPNREALDEEDYQFRFALDERGIAFVDDTGYVLDAIGRIQESKKWRKPSLERFLFDFLEDITRNDLQLLENYDQELDTTEDEILEGNAQDTIMRVTELRRNLQVLKIHYEQLQDFVQELLENENHFFSEEEMRYFRSYLDRITRLKDILVSLREHTMQIRDIYNYSQDEKQNRLMTYLTVVATIFMPLTLMTGWYGMNFVYMPELDEPYAYGIFALVCLLVIGLSIFIFRKKKWL